jgi:mono/diheme cytochrome c family protein
MYRNVILGVKALALLTVTAMALASPLEAQRSGADIWGANCGRCHLIQPTNRYDAKAWEDIGLHMAISARLTSDEATAVIDFLKIGARRVASAEALERAEMVRIASLITVAPAEKDPGATFKSQCAACHGNEGEGDGIASVAYNPRPTDFTDTEFAVTRTVAQVAAAITDGLNAMPPFSSVLTPEEISELAGYLMELSRTPAG